jgi:hypothetical protein
MDQILYIVEARVNPKMANNSKTGVRINIVDVRSMEEEDRLRHLPYVVEMVRMELTSCPQAYSVDQYIAVLEYENLEVRLD